MPIQIAQIAHPSPLEFFVAKLRVSFPHIIRVHPNADWPRISQKNWTDQQILASAATPISKTEDWDPTNENRVAFCCFVNVYYPSYFEGQRVDDTGPLDGRLELRV